MNSIDKPLFTIICVSHRPDVLVQWLLPSLKKQDLAYELKIVDQTKKKFSSCAAALNAGAAGATGKYLIFVHHDVAWDSPTFLRDVAEYLQHLPKLGVAGLVGSTSRPTWPYRRFVNAVIHGEYPGARMGTPIQKPQTVETLDELMLIVPADVFAKLQFDPIACDNWHLYGTDYALEIRKLGLRAYTLPMVVRHQSTGVISADFYRSLDKVRRKHAAGRRRIPHTCDAWDTGGPDGAQKYLYRFRTTVSHVRGLALGAMLRMPNVLMPDRLKRMKSMRLAARQAEASQAVQPSTTSEGKGLRRR